MTRRGTDDDEARAMAKRGRWRGAGDGEARLVETNEVLYGFITYFVKVGVILRGGSIGHTVILSHKSICYGK